MVHPPGGWYHPFDMFVDKIENKLLQDFTIHAGRQMKHQSQFLQQLIFYYTIKITP